MLSAKLRFKKYTVPLIAILILLAALCIFTLFRLGSTNTSSTPPGMREVKSYNSGITLCQALIPECGVCPGEVVKHKCFVPKGYYEQYN